MLAVAVAAGVAVGGAAIGQAWLLAALVDGAFLGGRTRDDLVPLMAALAGLAVARAALQWGADQAAVAAASRLKAGLRERLARAVIARGPVALGGERPGELSNTLVRGVDALDAYVGQYLPQAALAVLVPALVALVVLLVDPLSALVLVLTYPLIPLFMYLLGGAAAARTRAQWTVLARLSARFVDALQGLPTLKAFGRAGDETAAIAATTSRFRALTMGVLRIAFLSALVLELVATLSTAIVAVEVGLRLLYGRLAFQPALFVLILAPEFYRPLRALGAAFHAAAAGKEASARLEALLSGPPAPAAVGVGPAEPAAHDAAPPPGSAPVLHVHDLTVRYASDREPALDGVTFTVAAGATVALVGPSGAGKSTVASAILGFLIPDRGTLAMDEHRLEHAAPDGIAFTRRPASEARRGSPLDPDRWRQRLAWVPQRPYLFAGTLADNLRLARPDASEAAMMAALSRARLAEAVAAWPRGLDTPLGERGMRLSGGEAQRVALARAFLRDAPVVVLDEPTSSLDVATERAVGHALAELRRGRTVLVIAHRLSTVLDADRVVVLERGRIVEEGVPRELASLAGSRVHAMLGAQGGFR